jgi:hypothetical protein
LPPPNGTIHCDAIIDCTGRPAVFARSQGARRIAINRQIALIALLSASTDPDLSITIEAAAFGWWYSAQVPGAKRIVALFSDVDLLSGFDVKSPGGVAALIGATRHISALAQDAAMPAAAPAIVLADTAYLNASAGDGWCAAGDAAVSFDPLASTGIMNAVKSGLDAAQFAMAGFGGHQAYSEAVVESAMIHARQRVAYYRLEARWPSSPFWTRRQGERGGPGKSDREIS